MQNKFYFNVLNRTFRTFTIIPLYALAFFIPAQQQAAVCLAAPEIIQISVEHLTKVKKQWNEGLGISWGPKITRVVKVKLADGTEQDVKLTSVYSVSSDPYIELIKAEPQIGPWAKFDDPNIGKRPRTTIVWRVEESQFNDAKAQMQSALLTRTAKGKGFAYYESLCGVQFEVISSEYAPDPAEGVPNTPPSGIIDTGPLNHLSIPILPNIINPNNLPLIGTFLEEQTTLATGGGITWDVRNQYFNSPYRRYCSELQTFDHPELTYNCQDHTTQGRLGPWLNPIASLSNDAPFGVTATSTSFSHAFLAPNSGLDPAGLAAMNAVEAQMVTAGFECVISFNLFDVGGPNASVFTYYKGVDGIDVQILNNAFKNVPTGECAVNPGCGAIEVYKDKALE